MSNDPVTQGFQIFYILVIVMLVMGLVHLLTIWSTHPDPWGQLVFIIGCISGCFLALGIISDGT